MVILFSLGFLNPIAKILEDMNLQNKHHNTHQHHLLSSQKKNYLLIITFKYFKILVKYFPWSLMKMV